MATDLEEAIRILKHAHPDEVRITRFPDGRTRIEIASHQEKAVTPTGQGRWARVAEELAHENLLGQGLGDKVRASIRDFRDGFEFRDVFSDTGKQ